MKKRKIKKSVYAVFLIIILVVLGVLLISKESKEVESNNEPENEPIDEVVEEIPKEKRMSIIAVGDILIHESVYKDAYMDGKYDFSHMFTEIEPILKNYDLKFCNQE